MKNPLSRLCGQENLMDSVVTHHDPVHNSLLMYAILCHWDCIHHHFQQQWIMCSWFESFSFHNFYTSLQAQVWVEGLRSSGLWRTNESQKFPKLRRIFVNDAHYGRGCFVRVCLLPFFVCADAAGEGLQRKYYRQASTGRFWVGARCPYV